MGADSSDKLARLYSELLVLLKQEEEIRKETEKRLAKAKSSVDPRKEFNKWLQTNAGQAWKQKQFKYQDSKCAACGESLRFSDAVVHHVRSLKDFGSAANKPENFKLLHTDRESNVIRVDFLHGLTHEEKIEVLRTRVEELETQEQTLIEETERLLTQARRMVQANRS